MDGRLTSGVASLETSFGRFSARDYIKSAELPWIDTPSTAPAWQRALADRWRWTGPTNREDMGAVKTGDQRLLFDTDAAIGISQWLQELTRSFVVNRREDVELDEGELTDPAALGAARERLALKAKDYERLDREARVEQLREAAARHARQGPKELLDTLALRRGLGWHTIATMLGVTPTAIRKWRRGGSVTPENREQLAALVAFFEVLEQIKEPIADLGSWIEMRVREDTTLTPAAIYRAGPDHRWLLLEWARDYIDTATMLDRFDESWRESYARDPNFRVAESPAGERAIVPR
jgi:transcriptional regulator with XRE-family HTH domain